MEHKSERSRAANFSKEEETLLLRIVRNHNSIIENKKTDSVTNSMKVQKWLEIEKEFNSQNFGEQRDSGALRRKYENFKKGFKKKMNETITGSGSQEKIIFTDKQTELLQVIRSQAVKFQNMPINVFIDDDDVQHDNQITESIFMETNENKNSSSNDIETKPYIAVKTEDETSDANESSEMPSSTTSIVLPQASASHSNMGKHSDGEVTGQTKVTPYKYQRFKTTQPFSLAQSTHQAFRTRKRCRASALKQEQIFKKQLHEQKKQHLDEEHVLRKQLLEQQLRHAEERQSWLREEHLEKMRKI